MVIVPHGSRGKDRILEDRMLEKGRTSMSVVSAPPGHSSVYLARAAVTAPSVHNSQPWFFVADGDRGIEVHADTGRRLPLTDPQGREMLISCGAALFNVRLAMRHLGFKPVVHTFPDPRDPACLALVEWGAYVPPTLDDQRLYGALRLRHTVRGPFLTDPLPEGLADALREQAHAEGADLHIIGDAAGRRRLAELVRAGEYAHRKQPSHVAEQAAWTWRLARPRTDGVPTDVSVLHPDCLPFAGRDYAGLVPVLPTPPRRRHTRTGLVAILGTDRDDRPAWLRAGQALERILLYAAVDDVMAAFHTQPLELPHLRTSIRQTLSAGEFPQMILRLGYAPRVRPLPRRPLAEVLS
ncbi:NAD(P)H nitroreductase [Streptomyces atrovirens]